MDALQPALPFRAPERAQGPLRTRTQYDADEVRRAQGFAGPPIDPVSAYRAQKRADAYKAAQAGAKTRAPKSVPALPAQSAVQGGAPAQAARPKGLLARLAKLWPPGTKADKRA